MDRQCWRLRRGARRGSMLVAGGSSQEPAPARTLPRGRGPAAALNTPGHRATHRRNSGPLATPGLDPATLHPSARFNGGWDWHMKSTTAWRDLGLPRIADTPPALRIPVPPTLPRQPDEARALDALADALGVGDGRPRVVTTPNGVSVAIRRELLRRTVEGRDDGGASGSRGGWCRRWPRRWRSGSRRPRRGTALWSTGGI